MISTPGITTAFLLGVPRSGTTLLGALLNQHPHIHCPAEPWLLLALDQLGQIHPSGPCGPRLLRHALGEFLPPLERDATLAAWAKQVYARKAEAAGRKVFIDKTPRYHLLRDRLEQWFPDAPLIVILRHPLDVAASMTTTWKVDVAGLVRERRDHRLAADFVLGHAWLYNILRRQPKRIAIVRYEALVDNPNAALAPVWDVLGVPAVTVDPSRAAEAGNPILAGTMGDPTIRGTTAVHNRSTGRWRSSLPPADAASLAEALGHGLMHDLGYPIADESLPWTGAPDALATYAEFLSVREREQALPEDEVAPGEITRLRAISKELEQLRRGLAESGADPDHPERSFAAIHMEMVRLQGEVAKLGNAHAQLEEARVELQKAKEAGIHAEHLQGLADERAGRIASLDHAVRQEAERATIAEAARQHLEAQIADMRSAAAEALAKAERAEVRSSQLETITAERAALIASLDAAARREAERAAIAEDARRHLEAQIAEIGSATAEALVKTEQAEARASQLEAIAAERAALIASLDAAARREAERAAVAEDARRHLDAQLTEVSSAAAEAVMRIDQEAARASQFEAIAAERAALIASLDATAKQHMERAAGMEKLLAHLRDETHAMHAQFADLAAQAQAATSRATELERIASERAALIERLDGLTRAANQRADALEELARTQAAALADAQARAAAAEAQAGELGAAMAEAAERARIAEHECRARQVVIDELVRARDALSAAHFKLSQPTWLGRLLFRKPS